MPIKPITVIKEFNNPNTAERKKFVKLESLIPLPDKVKAKVVGSKFRKHRKTKKLAKTKQKNYSLD